MSNPNTHAVTSRVTEAHVESIDVARHLLGYDSRSDYIRDAIELFNRRNLGEALISHINDKN